MAASCTPVCSSALQIVHEIENLGPFRRCNGFALPKSAHNLADRTTRLLPVHQKASISFVLDRSKRSGLPRESTWKLPKHLNRKILRRPPGNRRVLHAQLPDRNKGVRHKMRLYLAHEQVQTVLRYLQLLFEQLPFLPMLHAYVRHQKGNGHSGNKQYERGKGALHHNSSRRSER